MADVRFQEWQIAPDKDGKYPDAQVTHAILQDIRMLLKSVQSMLKFFVVLTIIGLIGEVLYVLTHL
jgi:hypothetical protein